MPLLEKLGVKDEVDKIGMPKYGAEFVSYYHNKAVTFQFASAWDKKFPSSYQVRRADFDHILIKNAAAKGAEVIEECAVTEIDLEQEDRVIAKGRDAQGRARTWRAKFLVDATGRDTLLANKFDIKRRDKRHNSAALFGHFTGAKRFEGKAEGNISLFWFDHGWFWFIPLADGTTSVGAVCWPDYIKSRKTDLKTFFMDTIALCPGVADRLKDATLISDVTGTGNYSYVSDRMAGRNYIMLGDAFAFVDPLFSTGVYLAMNSAFLGADVVTTCLQEPARAAKALKQFDAQIRHGINTYKWYIYRSTTPALRNLLMVPRNTFRIEEAVLSVLAGDVFRPIPIRTRLLAFKVVYYLNSIGILKSTFAAWKMRRHHVRQPTGSVA